MLDPMPRKKSAIKLTDFNGQQWTRREVFIWLLALIVAAMIGFLIVTNVLGSWALLIAPILALGVGLMRYRAAALSPDDQSVRKWIRE
jgi:uncharacterized membrane protein YdbT with pleckstrin-like domain